MQRAHRAPIPHGALPNKSSVQDRYARRSAHLTSAAAGGGEVCSTFLALYVRWPNSKCHWPQYYAKGCLGVEDSHAVEVSPSHIWRM